MNLGPIQATIPPFCQDARGQEAGVEAEVKVQTVASMPQVVEDPLRAPRLLWDLPSLDAAPMVGQEVRQEVTFGVHSCRVNNFIFWKLPWKTP